ncbi:lambda exonuclease family protein [Glutamicibacter arilaitensis]|uniref:lambda exonuclease family protein n=1 Tax=Glutamicibacter arilaitensis TaxID=256701 RepID=UPI003FD68E84
MIIKTGARAATPKPEAPPAVVSKAYVEPPVPELRKPVLLSPDSLVIYDQLEQGTDEWLQARCGIVTASVVGKFILTKSLEVASNDTARGLANTLIAERITGHVEPIPTSRAMERGTLDEPYARAVYSEHYAPVTEVGFMVNDGGGFKVGYSPDGLVGDDGLVEFKSRTQRIQLQTILADMVPAENMAQLQTGLLVTGRKWIDYVSYCGGMPLYVKRVYPDQEWFRVILEAVSAFEVTATNTISRYLDAVADRPATERIEHFQEMEFRF